jgi:hypothetical protein
MGGPEKQTKAWKEKVRRELIEYAINVLYLALVLAAFTQYRRLLLAAYDITYTDYWVALIEALILGKVIMLGSVFRLGRGLETQPLIYPTLYKALVFAVFVGAFKLLEHVIKGLWDGEGLSGALAQLSEKRLELVLANSLVILLAFIPFFAVKELGRVLGTKKIWALFFRTRTEP